MEKEGYEKVPTKDRRIKLKEQEDLKIKKYLKKMTIKSLLKVAPVIGMMISEKIVTVL
jgi:hypothetical protein